MTLNKSLPLLKDLPFTYPKEVSGCSKSFLSVPLSNVAAYHFTAGTTGKRKLIYVTRKDLDLIVYNYSLGLMTNSLDTNDVAQIMYSFDIWQLGLIFQEAFRRIGVKAIPTGNLISFQEQQNFIEEYGVNVLAATPSYVYQLARAVDLKGSARENMKAIMLGGEDLSNHRRGIIQSSLGGEVFLGYGLMELGGGVASECKMHNGYHISTTVVPEVVDVKTGETVEKEEYGELVLTSLDREAMPLIRYRTGDTTRFIDGVCECGLKLPVIDYIKGRLDDRVTLGTAEKYYPVVFEELFEDVEEIIDFQIEITTINGRDDLTIRVYTEKASKDLEDEIKRKILSVNSLKIDIEKTKTINPPKVIFTKQLNHQNKKKTIFDNRKIV